MSHFRGPTTLPPGRHEGGRSDASASAARSHSHGTSPARGIDQDADVRFGAASWTLTLRPVTTLDPAACTQAGRLGEFPARRPIIRRPTQLPNGEAERNSTYANTLLDRELG